MKFALTFLFWTHFMDNSYECHFPITAIYKMNPLLPVFFLRLQVMATVEIYIVG
jgi:hypothetical protein